MAIVLSRRRLLALLSLFVFVVFLYLSSSRVQLGPVRHLRAPPNQDHNATILEDGLLVQTDTVQDASYQLDELSATLGVFSQVFIISRPTRLDRRATMEQLRAALSLNWTYIDAISSEDSLVVQIGECVKSSRRHNQRRTFDWPPRSDSAGSTGNVYSRATSASSLPLTCAVQDRTHGVKFKPSLLSYMLLTPAKFACWFSHLDAIQRVAAYDKPLVDGTRTTRGAALILEDDVDMERDIRGRLREVWNLLPDDWDIVFLGHCWSNEARYPALRPRGAKSSGLYPKMSVHPSFAPKCTHAYAVSPAGARRILLHLLYPPFAYSRALDQAFAWLVQTGRLRAFSVVPSLVVQHKLTGSDIDGGENGLGSDWKDHLEHGFF
ncbi:hypothetical protein C8T65DRAFT_803082 [Cerioporus squamosus]|nr:hypothetical protein C8T65DRAFT_803082 [Cerioporus squamosus]